MAFLKQLLVTALVLVVCAAGLLHFDPSIGRTVLNSSVPLPGFVRSAILAVAPEAGAPAQTRVAGTPRSGRSRRAQVVVAGTVGNARTRTRMSAIATGEAVRSVVVKPDNTTGIIASVGVKSGDEVKAGDILATLESSSEEVAVERARIALDAANEQFARQQKLMRSNAVSNVSVNDAKRARDSAELDLRVAKIALGKRQIRAPIDGYVGIVPIELGDLVSEQTTIATVDDRSQLKLVFYVPEDFVPDLRLGQNITAKPTARRDETYTGKIVAFDSRLDEASRTLRTEALVDNRNDRLRPGMSFNVSLTLPGEEFLSVDPLAVVWERDGAVVWKIENGEVVKAPVKIVERTTDQLLVSSKAIAPGDRIVVEGVQSVRENGPVEIQSVEPTAGEPRQSTNEARSGSSPPSPIAKSRPSGSGERGDVGRPNAPAEGTASGHAGGERPAGTAS